MTEETRKLELQFINRSPPKEADAATEQRKRDRENGRQMAMGYAQEALLKAVTVMRTSKDEKQAFAAAKYIMDRAWGPPKAPDEAEIALGNRDIFDVLASISAEITQTIEEKEVNASIQVEEAKNGPIAGQIADGVGQGLGGAGFFAEALARSGAIPADESEIIDVDEGE